MATYTTGELYNTSRTSWPEGAHLRLSPQGCELLILASRPTQREVEAVHSGQVKVGLVATRHVLVWLYRIGEGLPWSDAPWEAARQTSPPPGMPGERGDGRHVLLPIVLVDADSGIIRAQRQVTVPPRMADALRTAVDEQAHADPQQAAQTLAELYGRYTSTQLANDRAELVVKAGQDDSPSADQAGFAAGVLGRSIPGLVPGRSYPHPLPVELQAWYCYVADGGHSIAVVVPDEEEVSEDPAAYLVPVPVRTVLRTGWSSHDGYVYCRVPYDPQLGVLTEDGDDEF